MNKISTLIIRKLQGVITPPELAELEQFAAQSEENRQLVATLTNHETLLTELKESYQWFGEEDLEVNELEEHKKESSGKVRYLWRFLAAAVVVLLLGAVLWYYFPEKKGGTNLLNIPVKYFNATLKTSEWTIPLSNSGYNKSYKILLGERSLINTDYQLAYPVHRTLINRGIDTLETPKESLYSLLLPDSSTVWLNCASSLRYPSSFSDTERVVQLEGEAYFEIAKDPSRPFKVIARGAEIRVTGTKFNVKAYQKDGIVRTTLLEGSIKIKAKEKTEVLKTGEEAVINIAGQLEKRNVGSRNKNAVAWRKNQFDWSHEPLETIIEDICHWYGLQPVYKELVSTRPYTVIINRSRPIKEVLAILEANSPIKFEPIGDSLLIKSKTVGSVTDEP